MCFGFPASHSRSELLNADMSIIRQAVDEALTRAGWAYTAEDGRTWVAGVPSGAFSYGERVTVRILDDGIVDVESVCVWPLQLFDWGKNKRNIDKFFQHLIADVPNRPLGLDLLPPSFDEEGLSPLERALKDSSKK